ncbi:MAG: BMP family ABC transporter substrate-binding protein [Clostridia bacterium]
MKKVLVVILAFVLVLSCAVVFTACGDKDEEFKVGVIHIGDPADGSGYTYAHDMGIQEMQKELGLKDSQIVRKNSVDDQDNAASRKAMEECVAEGCDIIFATSFNYMNVCEELSAKYPDVIFSHGTGYKANETNFNNYFGRIYQARYISGVISGLNMTQGANAGYVSAFTTELAETCSGINSFALGVQSVNPTATVYTKSLSSWFNPTNEKAFAEALLGAPYNCEVIAQHCDTANPMVAAKAAGMKGIGYNSDMSKTDAGDAVLTSVVWDWGVYYKVATKAAKDGTWADFMKDNQYYYGSYNNGMCQIIKDNLSDKDAAYVAAVEAKYADDSWDVFSGKVLSFDYDAATKTCTATDTNSPLLKNDDTATGVIDDSVIKGSMNYLIKGVVKVA